MKIVSPRRRPVATHPQSAVLTLRPYSTPPLLPNKQLRFSVLQTVDSDGIPFLPKRRKPTAQRRTDIYIKQRRQTHRCANLARQAMYV